MLIKLTTVFNINLSSKVALGLAMTNFLIINGFLALIEHLLRLINLPVQTFLQCFLTVDKFKLSLLLIFLYPNPASLSVSICNDSSSFMIVIGGEILLQRVIRDLHAFEEHAETNSWRCLD